MLASRSKKKKKKNREKRRWDVHGVTVHGLAHQDVVVVVVGQDLLDGVGGAGLELLDGLLRGTPLLELVVDLLDVAWRMSAACKGGESERGKGGGRTLQVGLEGLLGGLHALLRLEPDETELVLDVVDHLALALAVTALVGVLARRGGVGALELEGIGALEVLAAVGLPEDAVNLLDVEGVGEQLVSGEDVLFVDVSLLSCLFFLSFLSSGRGAAKSPAERKKKRKTQLNSPCR